MVHRTPFFLPLLYPALTWRLKDSSKTIYLTFDDGPVPGPTDFVLDVLRHYKVEATFFCIGDNVRKHPKVFESILAGKHRVGNHTFNHVNGWKVKTTDYVLNTELCFDQFKQHDVSTTLFRPPYGRITQSQIKALSHHKIIMWDVLSVDYNHALSPERCLRNTVAATRHGSIVVFHDSIKAERNLTFAVPRYIETMLAKGYTFSVIPE